METAAGMAERQVWIKAQTERVLGESERANEGEVVALMILSWSVGEGATATATETENGIAEVNAEGGKVATPAKESAAMREEIDTKMKNETTQIPQRQTRALRGRRLPGGAMPPRQQTIAASIITEPSNPATAPAEHMALPTTVVPMAPIEAGVVVAVEAEGRGRGQFEMRAGWNIA